MFCLREPVGELSTYPQLSTTKNPKAACNLSKRMGGFGT
jgi:hypothetical protein